MHNSGLISWTRLPELFTDSVVSRPAESWILVILPEVALYVNDVTRKAGSVTCVTRFEPSRVSVQMLPAAFWMDVRRPGALLPVSWKTVPSGWVSVKGGEFRAALNREFGETLFEG